MSAATSRAVAPETLTGAQKCAVVCVALGPEPASRLLRQLSSEQVDRVTQAIASMPQVPPERVDAILREFSEGALNPNRTVRGGPEFARQLLESAFGPVRARAVVERMDVRDEPQLKRLHQTAPEVLAGLLRDEHPQTVALVLTHLDPQQAVAVIGALDVETSANVLFRMARMGPVSPESLALVEAGLGHRAELSRAQGPATSGGPAAVARLLNLAGGEREKQLMEQLGNRDADLAGRVRALMFVFDDLLLIDGRGIQRLLRDVETRELALALKAASDEVKQHIRSNMSERAGAALEEEIEMLGPVRVKEVEAAQARIIESVRALEESGEILVRGRGGSDDVIG